MKYLLNVQVLSAGLLAIPLVHAGMSNLSFVGEDQYKRKNTSRLKIVNLDTWAGSRNVKEIEALLRRENADFVLLSQFPTRKHNLLEDLKSIYPYSVTCGIGCRMAVLSKKKWLKASTQQRAIKRTRLGCGLNCTIA